MTLKKFIKGVNFFLRNFLTSMPYIIYYNFQYLPFKQAIKLPILIRVRNLSAWSLKGSVIIESDKIRFGMIKLGSKHKFYYKKGICLQNRGGTIIFRGKAFIGNETVIQLAKDAKLIFGANFGCSCSKFLCSKHIEFGKDCIVGINSTFFDSDFHLITDLAAKRFVNPTSPVIIGDNNWVGYRSFIMKGTRTPNNIIIRANSILDKKYKVPEYSIIGSKTTTELLSYGYWRNPNNDNVTANKKRILRPEDLEFIESIQLEDQ